MSRRTGELLAFIVLAALLTAIEAPAQAQSTARPVRIGVLITGTVAATEIQRTNFKRGLAELGYVEGRHYSVDERFADGVASRLPALAADLVQQQPDILLTSSTASTIAARDATRAVPIVSALMGDAVGVGLIASQNRPGGNVTGIVITDAEIAAKQFELARELVPTVRRIGILLNPNNSGTLAQRKGAEAAAMALSVDLSVGEVGDADQLETAFRHFAREQAGVVFVIGDALFFSERERIARVAISTRVPTMFIFRDHVQAGGLMSYGVDLKENYRRAATYVDRILKGARPSDLPVEMPTKFELVLNLKTAAALGLGMPPALLARADEVLE